MSATPEADSTADESATIAADAIVLAFDFGRKRIGVAIGQALTGSARALETVAVVDQRPDWDAITRLIEDWRPDHFVVGKPCHADGSVHPLAASIERFARRLHGRYHRSVSTMDEHLSTYAGAADSAAVRRAGRDAAAAQAILESWFVTHAGTHN